MPGELWRYQWSPCGLQVRPRDPPWRSHATNMNTGTHQSRISPAHTQPPRAHRHRYSTHATTTHTPDPPTTTHTPHPLRTYAPPPPHAHCHLYLHGNSVVTSAAAATIAGRRQTCGSPPRELLTCLITRATCCTCSWSAAVALVAVRDFFLPALRLLAVSICPPLKTCGASTTHHCCQGTCRRPLANTQWRIRSSPPKRVSPPLHACCLLALLLVQCTAHRRVHWASERSCPDQPTQFELVGHETVSCRPTYSCRVY